MFEKRNLKYIAVTAAVLVAVALIQTTPLAFLPHSADDIVQGAAAGSVTALVIGWLISRYISGKD